jgi:N-methylhydantoinase A
MGITVDIDTGGTFTDGLFTRDGDIKRVKVDTTPHDFTVSWMNCLREGAHLYGFEKVRDFLEKVDIMRWSSTVATNVIAERKGPKLGLFVTKGFKDSLYSPESKSGVYGHLIEKANVEEVELPLKMENLLMQLKRLLEQGVRRICISLKEGLKYEEEVRIKEILEEQYPDHYLGQVPLLLGRDICKYPDSMTRTHMALLNSYVHGPLATAMFKAEDELKDRGFNKPLLLGHIDGGVAKVSKTKPVDTIESGPIFGIHAAAWWSKLYNIPLVVTLDVGGTTTKVGLVEDFRPAITRSPDIIGIPLKQPMIELRSIALGGGTVAHLDGNDLKLGPQSMGAYPGPACYDLGGSEATLTDAYLANGFLDPEYFSGGAKKVNKARAEAVIAQNAAGRVGGDVQLAAYEIASLATDLIASEVKDLLKDIDRQGKEVVLFAFGGNGAMVACEVAKKAGISQAYVFSLGSFLSAFGSSIATVTHTYEHALLKRISSGGPLCEALTWMEDEARRDMAGEGFNLESIEAEVELVLFDEDKPENLIHVSVPWILGRANDEAAVNACFIDGLPNIKLPDYAVEIVKLRVKAPTAIFKPTQKEKKGKDPSPAQKGERAVTRGSEAVPSKVYEWDKLETGNRVAGPAVIEGTDTTYIIYRDWEMVMDVYGNGHLERRK